MIQSKDIGASSFFIASERKVAIGFVFALFCIFGLYFIYSVLVSWQKMCYRDAFGKEVRRMVMVRHIVYMLAFSLTNVYPFMNTFVIFPVWEERVGNREFDGSIIVLVMKVIFAAQGIIRLACRLLEPFFFSFLLEKMYCKRKSELSTKDA
jgi:hypothetical protein